MVEKRRYKRLFLSSHDKLTARFTLPGKGDFLETIILNLSEGGLGLSLNKIANVIPAPGDRMTLHTIVGAGGLDAVRDLEVEVKWVIHLAQLQHIGFGIEFMQLLPEARQQLKQFVSDWEHSRQDR